MTLATDWLTAIGTCGAAVVAVGGPAASRWLRRRHRPILDIGFGKDTDVAMLIASDLSGVAAYEITFRVTNREDAAVGVRAKLRSYVVRTFPPVAGHEFAKPTIRQQPLGWTSRPQL